MSKPKQFRVLLLLLILAPLTFLAFTEPDHRPDWDRPLIVGIYPMAAEDDPAVHEWIEQLQLEDFGVLEEWLAEQAAGHDLPLDRPFELRLGEPIGQAPRPPPGYEDSLGRLRWAAALRWWAWRFDDQGLDADIILVSLYHAPNTPTHRLRSIGMPSPRLALVKQSADRQEQDRNLVLIAHELLHTVGANDLYERGTGQALHPNGYVEPDQNPRYPQPSAEIMAMAWPIAPGIHIEPAELQHTRIGPTTAREIGW